MILVEALEVKSAKPVFQTLHPLICHLSRVTLILVDLWAAHTHTLKKGKNNPLTYRRRVFNTRYCWHTNFRLWSVCVCVFKWRGGGWCGLKPHMGFFFDPEALNKLIGGLHTLTSDTHTHTHAEAQKTNMLIQFNLCMKSRAHTSRSRETLCKDKESQQYLF